MDRGNNLDGQLRMALGEFYEPFATIAQLRYLSPVQARVPFIIKPW